MRVEPHELPKISVRKGDLVICEGGEPGRAAIWNKDNEFVIQKALHRFRCGADVLPEYMLLCLEHDYFSGRLSRYYTGATIKHLTGRALFDYPIPIPPITEQSRIVEKVAELTAACDSLEVQLRHATELHGRIAVAVVASITGITDDKEKDEPVKANQTELIAPVRLGTPPNIKTQAPLATLLARHDGEMSAKDLWQRFGGEIDSFYAQLKTEVAHGWIQVPGVAEMRQKSTETAGA
jgi:type I restriction enzyme S subunit